MFNTLDGRALHSTPLHINGPAHQKHDPYMKTSTLLLGLRAVVGYPVPFAAYGQRTVLFSNDPVGTRDPCATSAILVRQSGAHTKSGMCSAFDSLCPSHIYYLSPRTHLPPKHNKANGQGIGPCNYQTAPPLATSKSIKQDHVRRGPHLS